MIRVSTPSKHSRKYVGTLATCQQRRNAISSSVAPPFLRQHTAVTRFEWATILWDYRMSMRQYTSTSTIGWPTVIRMMQFHSWLRHDKPADQPQRTFVYLAPILAIQMQGFSYVAIQSIFTSSLWLSALRSWEDAVNYAVCMYALNPWRRWK